ETRDGRLVRIGQGGGRDLRRHDRLLGLCSAAARRPAFLAAFRASVVAAFAATLRTRLRPLTTLARPPATLTARPATVGTRPARAGIASAARAFTTARLAMAGPLCRMPWALRIFQGFGTRLRQQGIELIRRHALERAEVGRRQLGRLEVAQQAGALAAAGFFLLALGVFLLALGIGIGAPARQFVGGHLAVFLAELASGLPIQIE